MRKLFFLLSFCLPFCFLYAQTYNQYDKLINVVMPKAPEAAAFQRYGDIPIDYSTGVPLIKFPLYEVNAGNIQLPISLSYHASGIRVSDVATCVGLGFTLNAGGRINRTIIDKDDVAGSVPLNFKTPAQYETAKNLAIQTSTSAGDVKLEDLAYKIWYDKTYCDRMSDRYNLYLPNGKSVVLRKNFSTGIFEQIPFSSLHIEYLNDKFKITDADGIIYRFDIMDGDGWNLTRIEAQGINNFIEFTYGTTQFNSLIGNPLFVEESGPWAFSSSSQNNGQTCWDISTGPGITNITQYYAGGQQSAATNNLVTKISNNDVEVIFSYSNGRSDPGLAKLNEIKVIDKNSMTERERKKIIFNYSNFGNTANKTWRLKLNSFSILPSTSSVNETFSFAYDEDVILPPYFNIINHPLYHEDFWGYYNGTSALHNIPLELVKNSSNGSDRYPNPSFSKACSLKEVTYPTGGKTVYELENNYGMIYEYPFLINTPNGIGYGGGLRVKSIKNYASDGQLSTIKTYEYSGASHKSINSNQFSYDKRVVLALDPFYMGYEMNRTMAVSEPIESFSIGGNPSIIYNVKEFMGTPADNVGYTIYNYGFPSRQEENAYEFPNLSMKHAWQWDYGEEAPLLNDVSTYKKDPAAPSGYSLVKSEINEYVALKLRKFSTGINIVQNTSYLNHDIYWIELSGQVQYASSSQNSTFCIYTGPNPNTQAPAANMFFSNDNIFAVETAGYIASHLLTKKTEYIVSNNNHLTNTTEYTYDPSNILLKSQKTKSSEQNELITEYKYPSDFLTRVPYNTMVEKNMLTPVIEQTLTKNTNTLLQSTKTHFKFWNNAWTTNATNSLIVPEYLESKTLSNSYEPRLRYHSYDNKGNPTSVSKENDVKKAYIWGYNLIYPVAEVTGVDYNTIINSANLNQATINNPPNDEDLRAELNKIRQAFPSALVTTYTYKPLVGMTSQTDANGRTTYYEYDLFGRLKLIKDKNGNILKTFDYKYQQ